MSAAPKIVQLGLPWSFAPTKERQDWVRDGLIRGMQKMEDAGFQYKQFDVTPQDGVQPYIDYLKDTSVDGVIVGAGLYKYDEAVLLMEQLINATRMYAPKSVLMFSNAPDNALETTLRHFQHPKGSTK